MCTSHWAGPCQKADCNYITLGRVLPKDSGHIECPKEQMAEVEDIKKKQRLEGQETEKVWPSFGGLSPITYKLLEKWSWGNSSALELNEIAGACLNTWQEVPGDLEALAACGSFGHNPANTQRDLLRHQP